MATPWINEIHYDNAGTDTGEFIEIAGEAGTDLSGYILYLYNGTGGVIYAPTTPLSGIITNQQNGFGTISFSYPSNGIQNGSPDAVALVGPGNVVIQFLSYEGTVTATNGPALGMTSVDIGVLEAGTLNGQSLQLGGTGTQYGDFAWQAETAQTPGALNANQAFGGVVLPSLSISDPTVTEGNSGTTLLTYTVSLSAPAPAGGVSFDIATADGTATAGSDYVAKALTGQTIAAGGTSYSFTVTVNGDTAFEASETVLVNVANVTGATVADGQGSGTIANDDAAPPTTPPWINEIHYDNNGTDIGEFIEVAGAAGTDLTGYKLVLYNGNGGAAYGTLNLSGVLANQQGGFGTATVAGPSSGIQNGDPDAVALVAPDNTVIQFLSYGGSFTAVGGAANGMVSTDIGVKESTATLAGTSLQLGGAGTKAADFTWEASADDTPGAVNLNQSFGPPPPVVSIANASVSEGDSGTKFLTFTVTRNDTSTAFSVGYATADGTASAGTDYEAASGTLAFAAGGPASQTVSVAIKGDTANEPNETFTVALSAPVNTIGSTSLKNGTATGTILNDDVSITKIYEIQGAGHLSAYKGQAVTTQGVVTAVDNNGFYIQDATGDGDSATSDGLFVFTNSAPPAAAVVGALVNVTGTVQEFTPSGSDPGALSLTELSGTIAVTQLSLGNAAPTAVVLAPPTSDLQAGAAYFESLEGMRVTVTAPLVTGPTNGFGEIWTVANNGAGATGVNARGGILLTAGAPNFGFIDTVGGDFNPERIQIDPGLGALTPSVNTGAKLNDVTGILNYSFGNYEVLATSPVTVATPSPLVKTGTSLTGDAAHLLVASYNAENIDPGDGSARFATIGGEIVNRLNAPDIVAMQEIQDNNGTSGGTTNSTVTSASQTLQMIVDAINAAGGPQYAFVDNPFIGDDTNGGEPGGNIRTAYLYRTDRVSLVSGSLRTVGANGQVVTSADLSQQTDTNHPFYGSRPPLAADFTFNGQTVTVINNHFTSKGGSGVLMGSLASPPSGGEVQRAAQAQAVNSFVDGILAGNANAKVIVTGDLNDFEFEQPLTVLKGEATVSNYDGKGDPFNATATYTPGGTAILHDLQDLLPLDQRFDYVFDGIAQTLDHMLATGNLTAGAQFEPVHINAEFVDQTSDHDPLVGRFLLNTTPVALAASASGPEDAPVTGQLAANDPDGQALTYSLVAGPLHGAVMVNADGSYKYTPTADYNGADSFSFKASDGITDSAAATVSLTLTPVNDAPVALAASATVDEDKSLSGVLTANDIDTAAAALTYSLAAGPAHGTVLVNGDGTYKYTPAGNYNGADSFSFKVSDGSLTSTAQVSLTVASVNDGPSAVNDTAAVLERATVTIDVLANDTDIDAGDSKSILSVSATTKGSSVSIVGNKLAYTADGDTLALLNLGQTAVDSFTYVMKDAAGAASSATVQVTVTGVANGSAINGGNGADLLNGTAADETISGGNGDDTLYGLGGADRLDGGNGRDKLYGGDGIDSLDGGNDDDLLDGGNGADSLNGGNGNDTMVGGAGADTFDGGNGDDRMDGGDGDDIFDAGNGNDILDGGAGADRFFGGNGDDRMTGGAGADTFTGGNGSDTYLFAAGFGKDVVTDFRAGEDNLQLASSLFANYAAVMSHAAQVGSSVVITFDLDNTITLQGVTLSSLKAGDFIFA